MPDSVPNFGARHRRASHPQPEVWLLEAGFGRAVDEASHSRDGAWHRPRALTLRERARVGVEMTLVGRRRGRRDAHLVHVHAPRDLVGSRAISIVPGEDEAARLADGIG
jgi:hypothetical protein